MNTVSPASCLHPLSSLKLSLSLSPSFQFLIPHPTPDSFSSSVSPLYLQVSYQGAPRSTLMIRSSLASSLPRPPSLPLTCLPICLLPPSLLNVFVLVKDRRNLTLHHGISLEPVVPGSPVTRLFSPSPRSPSFNENTPISNHISWRRSN